jgi:hypothetical protein
VRRPHRACHEALLEALRRAARQLALVIGAGGLGQFIRYLRMMSDADIGSPISTGQAAAGELGATVSATS